MRINQEQQETIKYHQFSVALHFIQSFNFSLFGLRWNYGNYGNYLEKPTKRTKFELKWNIEGKSVVKHCKLRREKKLCQSIYEMKAD